MCTTRVYLFLDLNSLMQKIVVILKMMMSVMKKTSRLVLLYEVAPKTSVESREGK